MCKDTNNGATDTDGDDVDTKTDVALVTITGGTMTVGAVTPGSLIAGAVGHDVIVSFTTINHENIPLV